jgi:hypothetical protein
MEEHDMSGESDTSRFLLAGAKRVLWARTRQGYLAELMPRLREQIGKADNVIIESNSVIRFLKPDLYLTVLDPSVEDFKFSAKEFLDRSDAAIIAAKPTVQWRDVSLKVMRDKPVFRITPPPYVTNEIIAWVRAKLPQPVST